METIDAIIEHGSLAAWIELRAAALADPAVLADLRRLCALRATQDPNAPRIKGHQVWSVYLDTAFETDDRCEALWDAFVAAVASTKSDGVSGLPGREP